VLDLAVVFWRARSDIDKLAGPRVSGNVAEQCEIGTRTVEASAAREAMHDRTGHSAANRRVSSKRSEDRVGDPGGRAWLTRRGGLVLGNEAMWVCVHSHRHDRDAPCEAIADFLIAPCACSEVVRNQRCQRVAGRHGTLHDVLPFSAGLNGCMRDESIESPWQ
jgi:hypothetical protein